MFWRAALVSFVLAALSFAQGPPRLLVIDVDDVGYDLVADTPTPNLDRLAAMGRRLTSFYVAPSCTPTRASFNLGAYGSHPALLTGRVINATDTFEVPRRPLMPLAELVAAHGRTTAKIGKWHLAPRSRPTHPNEFGWQHYAGSLSNIQSPGWGFERYEKVTNGVVSFETTYATIAETEDALACVRGGVDLVSVSYHAPHAPWHEPPAHLHSIAPLATDRDRARAMLQAVDTELGRLLAEALPRGYTVIVFADNGTAQPLGGQKGSVLEGGVCVPCIAAGPGVVPGVDATPCGVVDLYATVLDAFGIPVGPPDRGPHSRSLWPIFGGQPDTRRWVYAERFGPNGWNPRQEPASWSRAVRGERYKLIRNQSPIIGDRLIDLWTDPLEQRDLIAAGGLPLDAAAALAHFRDVLSRL